MKCKLTGKEGKGVNAHIIPKSFYAIDPDEKLSTKLVSNTKGQYPKKTPIGIYDRTIVTEEGEKIFSDWDSYGAELLIRDKYAFERICHNNKTVFKVTKYDYVKLKLFFLSILWRASVSSNNFFRCVCLGSHEPVIRNALLNGNPGNSDWYAIGLSKWSDLEQEGITGIGMLEPVPDKLEGINYYRMYVGEYIVYCKVDHRTASESCRSFQLFPDSNLFLPGREFRNSPEFRIYISMLHINKRIFWHEQT